MKILRYSLVALLLLLTACSTLQLKTRDSSDAKQLPETVLITYHVKPGKEADLEQALQRAWVIYLHEHLVFAQPHLIVRDTENGDKTRVVEVFTWVTHSAPEQVPDSIKAIWTEMQASCEPRDGHSGLEGNEVEMVTPKTR
jgi:hypothetical protein